MLGQINQKLDPDVLVIGSNSYLGKTFLAITNHSVVAHKYFDEGAVDWVKIKVVINFSLNPLYKTSAHCSEIDEDSKIVKAAKNHNVHCVMLSSRMVYSPSQEAKYSEHSPIGRNSVYASNKIITEIFANEILPNNHTILRLGNIFGLEFNRPTFFGISLNNLREKKEIVMDCSLSTKRDFLPIKLFCQILDQIIETLPIGTFNLSSGHAISVGDIASAIIIGYGAGLVKSINSEIKDPFNLDITKLQNLLGFEISRNDVLSSATKIGELLKNA